MAGSVAVAPNYVEGCRANCGKQDLLDAGF